MTPPQPLDASEVWSATLDRLKGTMTASTFDIVFGGAYAESLHQNRLRLAVRTDWSRKWIHERFHTVLCDALFEVVGQDIEVEILVRPEASPEGGRPTAPPPVPPAPPAPRRASGLQPALTFENFVIGTSNRFAHAAAQAVAENPRHTYNPLFIYGGVGLGKTHLLHAIGHFVAGHHPGDTCHYVSAETFTNDFVNAVSKNEMDDFKRRYRSVDVLLIDDVQLIAPRERTQEEFFHTFNALHENGKQIVLSSDRPPRSIDGLESRLRSRFEMGLMTDVQPPDLETRIAILQTKIGANRAEVPPEVLHFIAARVDTNVRSLEGALTRVIAQASLDARPITVDLASEILGDLFPTAEVSISAAQIKREVCRYFDVTTEELDGTRRTRRIVGPRQVAMYLCRELTDASLPEIGRAFGGRDHTTVIHAVDKVATRMANEDQILTAVQALTGRITGSR